MSISSYSVKIPLFIYTQATSAFLLIDVVCCTFNVAHGKIDETHSVAISRSVLLQHLSIKNWLLLTMYRKSFHAEIVAIRLHRLF